MRSPDSKPIMLVVFRGLVTACVLLLLWQCSENPVDPDLPPRELTKAESHLVSSGNGFGLRLFRTLVQEAPDSNIFISPLSVAMALGMAYNGADGTTKEAMEATLELSGLTIDEVNESYRDLIDLLENLDRDVAFQIANSIWYRLGFQVEPEFLDVNQTYFDAEVAELDFGSPEAVATINHWVDDKTHGKIKEIVKRIGPAVVMYLINAIYFKGTWTYEFDPEETMDDQFHSFDGSTVPCHMMNMTAEFDYYSSDRFQAVDLPYGNGKYSMTVVLPNRNLSVDDLIEEMTTVNWDTWMTGLARQEIALGLPRFKLEYEKKLNDALTALGMGIAFTPAADFSKIRRSGGLWISEVKHKTFVEVDEEGTEAAAVTSVEFIEGSPGEPPSMWVNRPFIFAIRENHSGTILFIGKMVELPAEDG